MKKFLLAALILSLLLLYGCENFMASGEFADIMSKDDLSMNIKVDRDAAHKFTIEKINEADDDGTSCLKIDVENEFSIMGEAKIEPGKKYRISFTMKNESADPIIQYSFWKKPVTVKRRFVLNGKDGNPPESCTQKICGSWTTFEETFETMQEEDTLILSLYSKQGIFYIKDICIEQLDS